MRRFVLILISALFSITAWADVSLDPLFNKVILQLSAEQWVTSKTALVNVAVNASVSDNAIEKIQGQVLDKLSKLSDKGEWHIISLDRSLDKSGLERIQIMGQARLPNTDLAGLRDKAKAISKPGETYTIDNIQFVPSDDEIRDANSALRDNVYQQVKAELARLAKAYPDQKYYLHNINFASGMIPGPIMPQNVMLAKVSANGAGGAAFPVGDKLRLYATVELTTVPDQNLIKLIHN